MRCLVAAVILALFYPGCISGAADRVLPLGTAMAERTLTVQFSGDGSTSLSANLSNAGTSPATVEIAAGTIFSAQEFPARVISLRSTVVTVEPDKPQELSIPVAALSTTNHRGAQPFAPTNDREPALDALLTALSTNDNVPRDTSQLAVLALREDISFSQWLRFTTAAGAEPVAPTTAQVAGAIDAAAIVKSLAPGKTFALLQSNDLKLRALRNPDTRAKAMAVFSIPPPADVTATGGVAPDLGQLLHTKAGDNCPVCRMRQGLDRPANDL